MNAGRIAGYDAIEDVVGRTTELGKPVMAVPGRGLLSDPRSAQILSALSILDFTAKSSAKYDYGDTCANQPAAGQSLADEIGDSESGNWGMS